MPRSVVSGLVAVLALAAVVFGVVRLAGGPAPGRAGSPPLMAHGAGDWTADERIDLRPGPADAVLTERGDLTRLGMDDQEPALSPAAVSSGTFGRRISYPVDGKIYAQPLYVPGLRVDGRVRNVVIVVTEHDSVYAFDADAKGAAPAPLWRVSLLMPGARPFEAATDRIGFPPGRLCDSIAPEVGITSTPVVDWAAKTLFVMALGVEHGTLTYRWHALDAHTGQEKRTSVLVA